MAVPEAPAQITLDGTLGPHGPLEGPDYLISDAMGEQVGGNLFHSFGEFNVHTGESATFDGPGTVENIIGRVTGGSASLINGLVSSAIPGADLFLINPSGVLFGPDAFLDISGSFYASTAGYLRLGESGRFDAVHPATSLLSIAAPSAFGFPDGRPEGIAVEGSFLHVPEGEILSLVGGDIRIEEGTLYTEEGDIGIASIASGGEALLDGHGIRLECSSQGSIELSGYSYMSVAGSGRAGIFIRGGRFVVRDSMVSSMVEGDDAAGCIDIRVQDEVRITEAGEITSFGIDEGRGSAIVIDAASVVIEDDGSINSACDGQARGGDITITAGESVHVAGGYYAESGIYAWTEGEGDAGCLTISSPSVTVADNAVISGVTYGEGAGPSIAVQAETVVLDGGGTIENCSYGPGRGGDIDIQSSGDTFISGYGDYRSGIYAQAYDEGDAGGISLDCGLLSISREGIITGETDEYADGRGADIAVSVQQLKITEGGAISVATYGPGKGGEVRIQAEESVLIAHPGEFSSTGIGAETWGPGDAGSITIAAPLVTIADGGEVSGITQAEGRGADVLIDAGRVSITDGYVTSSCLEGASGDSGDIVIRASEHVLVSSLAESGDSVSGIFSMTGGHGDAGGISVSAPAVRVENGAEIGASTAFGTGRAGDIRLSTGSLEITDGGRINSSSEGAGQGGMISMNSTESVRIDGGRVMAIAGDAGDAGGIETVSPCLDLSDEGVIETLASGEGAGQAGEIRINVGEMSLTGGGMINSSTLGVGRGGDIGIVASGSASISAGDDPGHHTGIFSMAGAEGDAGGIRVFTPSLRLEGHGSWIMASTVGSGRGGEILLDAGRLHIYNGAHIMADSGGTGDAGAIRIRVTDIVYCEHGLVTTEALRAEGGDIRIDGDPLLHLIHGGITATVTGGSGNGGNIDMQARSAVLEKGRIIANAEGGRGGNIRIVSGLFIASPESMVSASSRLGIDGVVEIDAPCIDLGIHMVSLPGSFRDLGAFLPRMCIRRDEKEKSSFLIRPGSVPPSPTDFLQGL
ncbi:MAG: filamentous hemagglutinin N-terminal domain-containing protein [bacterium]